MLSLAPRRFFRASRALLKDALIPVPRMGDSITEGTLIKFAVSPGQALKLDDIVCVIETDKVRPLECTPRRVRWLAFHVTPRPLPCPPPSHSQVSVDVRSPLAGVLKAFHAELQANVAVGAPLFTVDSDGTATVAASPSAAPASSTPAPAPAVPAAPAPVPASHAPARTPSIHFKHGARSAIDAELGFGGGGGARASTAPPAAAHTAAAASATGDYILDLLMRYPHKAGAQDATCFPARFGRPVLSDDEAFLISSGGAYGSPPPPPKTTKEKKM